MRLKMEKLKGENRFLKEEMEAMERDKTGNHKRNLELEKQVMEGRSKLETQDFDRKLQGEQIEKLKAQVLKLQKQKDATEKERETVEEDWIREKEDWARERQTRDGKAKDERRKAETLEAKLNHKDDFIGKLLDMLKIPLKGQKEGVQRLGDSSSSIDYLEDEKRLYKHILEELQMRNKQERIKGLFEIQKNMSPLTKDAHFALGDMEIEQQIIHLKKGLENKERELAELKRKAGLRETELEEEVKSLAKQVEEMKAEREKAKDKAKKFRTLLKEAEEKLEEEEDRNNKKVYELTKATKEREYSLKVAEHELGLKNSELDEQRHAAEKAREQAREMKADLKKAESDLQEIKDDLRTKGERVTRAPNREAEETSRDERAEMQNGRGRVGPSGTATGAHEKEDEEVGK